MFLLIKLNYLVSKMDLFKKEDIERLVRIFATRLSDAGITGSISLVGGAALSTNYLQDRHSTSDIDALFPCHPDVARIIEEISLEEGLESDWINDAAIAWVPFESKELWIELYRIDGIQIRIASADLLLAMKLKADRGVRDRSDIEGLIRLIGIETIEEIDAVYERFHDQEVLNDLTRAVVLSMLRDGRSSRDS